MKKRILSSILNLIKSPILSTYHNKELPYNNDNLKLNDEYRKEFFTKNRQEVLCLYRDMLKNIPPMERTHIRRTYLMEEIKFNFREHSREDDCDMINKYKLDAYIIIEKINNGVFPPFPQYRFL